MAKRKTKDRVIRTSLKTGGKLRFSSFCNEMRQFHPLVNIFCHKKLGKPRFWVVKLLTLRSNYTILHSRPRLIIIISHWYFSSNLSVTHVQSCEKNILFILLFHSKIKAVYSSSWSWSYGSWIYNYLCNQCLSPLTLWVWIPLRRDVQDAT